MEKIRLYQYTPLGLVPVMIRKFSKSSGGSQYGDEILIFDNYTLHCTLKDLIPRNEGEESTFMYGNAPYIPFSTETTSPTHSTLIVNPIMNLSSSTGLNINGFYWRNVISGTNEYMFVTPSLPNRWVGLYFYFYDESDVIIGDIKLMFSNSEKISISEAVNRGYIYPLVPALTWTMRLVATNGRVNDWTNIAQLVDGVSRTNAGKRRIGLFMFKMKSLTVNLVGVEFYCNKNITPNYNDTAWLRGFNVFMESADYDLSAIPFNDIGSDYGNILRLYKYSSS